MEDKRQNEKKLALVLLTAVSCACFAIGLSACGDSNSDNPSGTTSHTLTYTEAKAATCTEEGNSAYYYCTDCGKYFSDAAATTEIQLSSTVIPALGHDYETTFTWTATDDGYTVAATRACKNDSSDTETVTATVTSVKTDATCTEKGSIVYTATAAFASVTETDTKTITLAALGHSYSEEWSYDESYHWHAATCEHTDEVSEKAGHSYVQNSNGDYVCSVCGQQCSNAIANSFITASGSKLAVGANYIVLDNSDSSLTSVTFTATASGTYTLSLSSDSKALIYVYDPYGNLTRLGYSGYSDYVYSASFDLSAGESLTLSTILAGEGYTFDSEYVFCLSVEYEYKYIAAVGEEGNPYAFTEPSLYGADTNKVTLAAGASYYFTVTSTSETLAKISFSSSDASAFELYVNGTKVDYGTYRFSSSSAATTFCLKNISSGELENTISCEAYELSLSASENELEITSATLNSTNSITYYVTISASTTYNVTLGDGTDSNVAVYYTGYYGSTANDLILGSGATASTYQLTNTSTRNSRSFYLTFTYTGSTIPESFKVYINFEEVTESGDEGSVTYTPVTLNETFSINFSTASTHYYSYTPATSDNFTIVLTFSNTAFYGTMLASIVVTANGTTVTGSQETDGVYYVIAGGESEYNISITFASATMTLTGTVISGGEVAGAGTELSLGANDVEEYASYYFTATEAGTYTFTISGTKGYGQLYESSSSYTALVDEEGGSGSSTYTVELTAGQTVTLYTENGSDGAFVLTITKE